MKKQFCNLPSGLTTNLVAAENKTARVEALTALARLLLGMFGTFLPFLILERLFNLPVVLRWFFFLILTYFCLRSLFRWGRDVFHRRRQPLSTVRRIEKHFRSLGDTLQSIIELARVETVFGSSESLRQAAIRQVVRNTESLDFCEAISTRRLRRLGSFAAPLLVLALLFSLLEPQMTLTSVRRLLFPGSPIPRYTFTRLADLPERLAIPRGEAFSLSVELDEKTRRRPGTLSYKLGGQRYRADFVDSKSTLKLPPLSRNSVLKVVAGDARIRILLRPTSRPALVELLARVTPPAYLQQPNSEIDCTRKTLRVVEGSQVLLRGKTLNPLVAASMQNGDTVPLKVKGKSFETTVLAVDNLEHTSFSWKDSNGLEPTKPLRLKPSIRQDAPPSGQFPGHARVCAILPDEVLEIAVRGRDDFGVQALMVNWRLFPADDPDAPESCSFSRLLAKGDPKRKLLETTFQFSPRRLNIPAGTRVLLHSMVSDYKPGRDPVLSEPSVIYVLTAADHARLIQNKLAALRNRIEEAVLNEAEQLAVNREIAARNDEQLQDSQSTKTINQQAEREEQNVGEWKKLTEQGAELLAEALKNKQFSEETLDEWTKLMEALQKISTENLPQAASALSQAGESGESRRQKMEEAVSAQEEALEALKKASEEMNDSLDHFALLSLALQLRSLAGVEGQLSSVLRQLLVEVVGRSKEELDAEAVRNIATVRRKHDEVNNATLQIRKEVRRLVANTMIEKYEKLGKAMDEAKFAEELEALTEAIGANHLAKAIPQTVVWQKKFNDWAEILDPRQDGGGGGGGGGEMSEENLKFMLALLQIMQEQDNVNRDTIALDGERNGRKDYKERAGELADAQFDLSDRLRTLAEKLQPLSEPRDLLDNAEDIMYELSGKIRKPDTGSEIQLDQKVVLEILAGLFKSQNSGGQGKPQNQSTAAMLAMLAQKLGVSVGRGGGGSMAGGESPDSGGKVGDGEGSGGGDKRRGGGAGERSLNEFPAEFRSRLDIFFKRLEETEK